MPFNGSGNYVPPSPPVFPAISGDVISSSYFNQVILDIATGLSMCITRDGQGKPTADIDWNGQDLTNIGAFSALTGTLGGSVIWTAGNDGPGSGLDADTVDGLHAASFLLASAYTAADVLAKLLTVDGSGSGLDADLLDGQHGTYYARVSGAVLNSDATGYLGMPPNAQTVAYALVMSDMGKHVYYSGAAAAITIPTNATVAFPTGTVISIVNDGSGVVTLTRSGGVAMIWSGVGVDANRSLAVNGIATLIKVGTDRWYVSGTGLS